MLYREIIAVCSEIHTKPELYIKTQSVPRSKHSVSVIQTSQLMLYTGLIAVCSQIHTKHINTLCGQNVELLNVKTGGTNSDHWGFQRLTVFWVPNKLMRYQFTIGTWLVPFRKYSAHSIKKSTKSELSQPNTVCNTHAYSNVTNSKEQRPSSQANSSSGSQGFPRISSNPKV